MFRGGRRAAIGNTSSVELVQRSMFGCAKRAVAYTCLSFAFFLGCAGHPVKPPNGAATPPASISRALVGHHDLLNLPGWESRLGDDEMNLNCNLFDHSGGAENNVVFRATTNLHEAWHAWEHANVHFGAISHLPGPQGNCSIKGDEACDPFYAHDLDTFHPFGRLIETGVSVAPGCAPTRLCAIVINPRKFHSPTQIEWEFMCDLLAAHADWVTNDILSAASASQYIDADYFVQTPPFDCGVMSPI